MYLADALGRAYLPVNACDRRPSVENIDTTKFLPVMAEQLPQIRHAPSADPVVFLSEVSRAGWPGQKRYVLPAVQPYWDHRDELVLEGQLIFKGHRIVIPVCLRKELIAVTHASHVGNKLGIEGCVRHACEELYWPYMYQDMKKYISTRDVCLAHQASQQESLTEHEVVMHPWAMLAVDLCALHGGC